MFSDFEEGSTDLSDLLIGPLPKAYLTRVVRVSLALMKVAIKPAIKAETISAPANIKNWIRTSSIFQVQNLNSLLTCLKHPFK